MAVGRVIDDKLRRCWRDDGNDLDTASYFVFLLASRLVRFDMSHLHEMVGLYERTMAFCA